MVLPINIGGSYIDFRPNLHNLQYHKCSSSPLPFILFVLSCHWRYNVFQSLDSLPSIYCMRDAGIQPLNVHRPREGCQSCLIIVCVNLICACADKVWPLLFVMVWLTYLIHNPTAQTTGECNCCQAPLNCLSFLNYAIPFHFFALLLPFHPRCGVKIQIYARWEMTCGLDVVTVVWNRMTNNKGKVMDGNSFMTRLPDSKYIAFPQRRQPDLAALQRPRLYGFLCDVFGQ